MLFSQAQPSLRESTVSVWCNSQLGTKIMSFIKLHTTEKLLWPPILEENVFEGQRWDTVGHFYQSLFTLWSRSGSERHELKPSPWRRGSHNLIMEDDGALCWPYSQNELVLRAFSTLLHVEYLHNQELHICQIVDFLLLLERCKSYELCGRKRKSYKCCWPCFQSKRSLSWETPKRGFETGDELRTVFSRTKMVA